tara:strand:+ start:75 stop:413 length:339 start_codon:yes stop_codon:yes gene_type:complete
MSDERKGWDPELQDGDEQVATEERTKVKKPRLYKVLLHNDDYTTMEFVVTVLQSVFHLDEPRSVQVMLHVHRNGVGVAGVYSYEIAETKLRKTTDMARKFDFPLRCTMEPSE